MSKIHAVVIGCIDYRLKDPRSRMFWTLFGKHADIITLPGSAICVAHTVSFISDVDGAMHWITPDMALEQLHLSITAHNPKEIWIVAHQDCAATTMLEMTEKGMSNQACKDAQIENYQEPMQMIESIFGRRVRLFYQTLTNRVIRL
jgi:carbonic anhydrase